ncbi:hypothetical protein LguiA_005044 [Lonicera macranthoides]
MMQAQKNSSLTKSGNNKQSHTQVTREKNATEAKQEAKSKTHARGSRTERT